MCSFSPNKIEPEEFAKPFSDEFADLLNEGRYLYNLLREKMPKPWREQSFEIEILDDPSLNAEVRRSNHGYVIYVNRGALQHIFGTTFGLFCCPKFMPNIGNAEAELGATLQGNRFPPIPLTDKDDDSRINIPQDEVRRTIAHLLAVIALHFLLYHEIGHIVGGHFEILNIEPCTTTPISEFVSSGKSVKNIRLRHVLEFDADAFASHVSFGTHSLDGMKQEICKLFDTDIFPPEDCSLIALLTAVAALFRMLYPTAPPTIDAALGTDHPHPTVRDLLIGSSTLARAMTHQLIPAEPEKLDYLLRHSVRNLEEVWAELFLPGQIQDSPTDWLKNLNQVADDMFKAYADQKQLLEKHAHIPRKWHDWE